MGKAFSCFRRSGYPCVCAGAQGVHGECGGDNSFHLCLSVCFHVSGDQGIRVFVQEPKAYTASVGETVRFTCVGIYPQVSYPDVCITHSSLYVLMLLPGCLVGCCCYWLLLLLLTDWLLLPLHTPVGAAAAALLLSVVACCYWLMMLVHWWWWRWWGTNRTVGRIAPHTSSTVKGYYVLFTPTDSNRPALIVRTQNWYPSSNVFTVVCGSVKGRVYPGWEGGEGGGCRGGSPV